MGSLFDELKKSKLIDQKRARQLAHEQRVEKKQGGGDLAKDEELARKQKDFDARRDEERRRHRESERERQVVLREKERFAEVKQLVAARTIGDEAAGGRRWHFLASNGSLPFLPVNETATRRLQAGEYAIVRDPNVAWPRYVIVPRETAVALRRIDEKSVCYLAGA